MALGRSAGVSPNPTGLDEFFGLPYCNDVWPLRPGVPIDGGDTASLMFGVPRARSSHEVFFRYDGQRGLAALRSGRWKLMFPQPYNSPVPGSGGLPGKPQRKQLELSLFDLQEEIGGTTNVAAEQAEIVARLREQAKRIRGSRERLPGPFRRPISN